GVAARRLAARAAAVSPRRMEYPAPAEPEGDVVRPLGRAETDEVARPELRLLHRRCRGLLLVRVARNKPAETPVGHVHEPRAVDPALGQAAPLVRRPEVGPRLLDVIARSRQAGPLAV